ncbi:MAG: dihydrolipoamide acetyltransferase family protein [bacterium]
MFEFKLPDLGEGIHEGELLEWHVKEGDIIEEDADLMDVETDKAAVTIPSPKGGKVVKLNGKVGDTLHVGEVVIVIDDGTGGELPASAKAEEKHEAPKAKAKAESAPAAKAETIAKAEAVSVQQVSATSERSDGTPLGKVAAAPAVRRLSRELGVDIHQIQGSGPSGRVTKGDVEAFASGGAPVRTAVSAHAGAVSAEEPGSGQPAISGSGSGIPYYQLEPMPNFEALGEVEREPVRSIRRKVAFRMTTSMVTVPHVAHMDEADVTDFEAFRVKERERRKDQPGGKLTLLPFVMKAVTVLLKKYPMFNASLDPFREEIVYKKFYNLGFAADTPRGLIVPVVKGTDKKSILDISADIVNLATKGREGMIEIGDMQHGTFTITNVGPIGGTGLIPTINYPEVAILGMGKTQEKPVVREGEIVIRKMLPLTLAFDHRVADGAQAAHFVTDLTRLLSDPRQLLLEL